MASEDSTSTSAALSDARPTEEINDEYMEGWQCARRYKGVLTIEAESECPYYHPSKERDDFMRGFHGYIELIKRNP